MHRFSFEENSWHLFQRIFKKKILNISYLFILLFFHAMIDRTATWFGRTGVPTKRSHDEGTKRQNDVPQRDASSDELRARKFPEGTYHAVRLHKSLNFTSN